MTFLRLIKSLFYLGKVPNPGATRKGKAPVADDVFGKMVDGVVDKIVNADSDIVLVIPPQQGKLSDEQLNTMCEALTATNTCLESAHPKVLHFVGDYCATVVLGDHQSSFPVRVVDRTEALKLKAEVDDLNDYLATMHERCNDARDSRDHFAEQLNISEQRVLELEQLVKQQFLELRVKEQECVSLNGQALDLKGEILAMQGREIARTQAILKSAVKEAVKEAPKFLTSTRKALAFDEFKEEATVKAKQVELQAKLLAKAETPMIVFSPDAPAVARAPVSPPSGPGILTQLANGEMEAEKAKSVAKPAAKPKKDPLFSSFEDSSDDE